MRERERNERERGERDERERGEREREERERESEGNEYKTSGMGQCKVIIMTSFQCITSRL